jgi:two-component system chemotaxis response regulator CheB
MPIKVLVVDDSNFFQQRLKEIINEHPDLEVIGIAANGREAVEKAESLRPDVITMDFEMPVMDGVTAVRHIMAKKPIPILMFSSLTYEGARITLDALDAGAVDFMSKNFAEISQDSAALKRKLHQSIRTIARKAAASSASVREATSAPLASRSAPVSEPGKLKNRLNVLLIGASTGGPVALPEVLKNLPANFPLPIILVQHMPENFTKAFAERMNKQCKIQVKEAVDGDVLRPGLALLAPGGKQLLLDKRGGRVQVLEGDSRVNYKPSVDVTFGSAANCYGDRALGIILTGMGADGCEGARMLKNKGSTIWSQDKESCIVYGMPMAVARANITDEVLSLKEIGPRILQEI